jgi:predicted ester cyclase
VTDLHPLAALLRRYSFGYTAAHDFAVCRELMVEDYVLRMGEHEVRGRDTAYVPATEKQYRQYPGLGFTVHELVLGEDRAALHFTEHGRSVLHGGGAAWSGISLYRWDGARLVECRVEQDYAGRRAQQRSGRAHRVQAPGIDPWTVDPSPAGAATESVVRDWLGVGGLADAPAGSLDDEHSAAPDRVLLDGATTTVLDLFAAGDRAAFPVLVEGTRDGRPAALYATGLASVAGGEVVAVRAITDRLAAERRLGAPAPA